MTTAMRIMPANPAASYQAHKAAIDAAIHRVLDSGWYILGRRWPPLKRNMLPGWVLAT